MKVLALVASPRKGSNTDIPYGLQRAERLGAGL